MYSGGRKVQVASQLAFAQQSLQTPFGLYPQQAFSSRSEYYLHHTYSV